jgi:hypothetical protein
MKKFLSLTFLLSFVTASYSQDMSNLHQVLTTEKTQLVCSSDSGMIFYATNSVTDKRVVVYDPSTGNSTTIDTGYNYMSIISTPFGVYVGCDLKVTKYTSGGTFINTMSCLSLGITPYNAGIHSMAYDPTTNNMYFGTLNKVVYATENFSFISNITPLPLTFGSTIAKAITFKQDTLFIGLFQNPTSSGTSAIYVVGNVSTPYGQPIASTTQQTCTDVIMNNDDLYFTRLSGGVISRNDDYNGAILFDASSHQYTCAHNSSSIWFGTNDGLLFELGSHIGVGNYNSTTTDMKSMFNVDTLFEIYTDVSEEIWIATDKGLYTTSNLSLTTGIIKNEIEIFNMYPNPTIGEINFEVQKETELSIFNSTGSLISNYKLSIGKNSISINLNPGMYVANISGYSKTFIVQQ